MSHELEENIDRRKRITAKVRQHSNGVSQRKLMQIIMDIGYNFRGAKEKIRELLYAGWLKEKDFRYFDAETYSNTRKREEGK
ncbi:MAG: hypothetical protein ACXACA_02805 [Candidatus Ranarchaeia archaeon]